MSSIWVLGGANIDVCGTAIEPLREYDSNPGTIELRFGGVARNVAQTCALLGHHPIFLTCFSDDHYGTLLRKNCEDLGMDCTHALVSSRYPTSLYLAILDEKGELFLGMNDMRILEEFDLAHLHAVLQQIRDDDVLVLDTNLSPEMIQIIIEEAHCTLAMDPISIAKIERAIPLLSRLQICKPNRIEAEHLTGIPIDSPENARNALDWFLSRGVKEILISMAQDGLLLGTASEKLWLRHRPAELENVTGGGDALLGAYLCTRQDGKAPAEAAADAITAALWTIEAGYKGRLGLSRNVIAEQREQMQITIESL